MKEVKQSEEKPILLVSNPYVTDSSLSSSKPLPFRPDQNNGHNVVGQGDVSMVLENPGGQKSQSESLLRVKDDFVHQQESSQETEVESDPHQHQHRHEDAVDGESLVIDFPSGGGFSLYREGSSQKGSFFTRHIYQRVGISPYCCSIWKSRKISHFALKTDLEGLTDVCYGWDDKKTSCFSDLLILKRRWIYRSLKKGCEKGTIRQ